MAAERLVEGGAKVTVYEHKRSAGRKFLLAGRGGLNITHGEPLDELVDRYGPARSFLEPALRAFSPDDLRAWCDALGEPTFVGSSDRVFPESFRATPLLRAWLRRLADAGVELRTGVRWEGWSAAGDNQFETSAGDAWDEPADATVFALGGASWPRVGSDGGWVASFEKAGIEMRPFSPANAGIIIEWSDALKAKFEGAPIKNAVFSCGDVSARGDAVVTSAGLEGGPIYALGPAIRDQLGNGQSAKLLLDLHPDLETDALTQRLSKRRPKASVTSWLGSAGVSPLAVSLAREATANQLPNDPDAVAALLKAAPIAIAQMAPIERAISSAGGIALAGVDQNYMTAARPGVFIAGEMLDWEAPTGGYLLQACFSTGRAAAEGALRWLGSPEGSGETKVPS